MPKIISLVSVLFLLSIGASFLFRLTRISVQKSKTTELESFISEGLLGIGWRTISAIFQLVLYVVVALFVASFSFSRPFPGVQAGAFAFGGFFLGSSAYFAMILAPKMVPRIIAQSRNYVQEGVSTLFQASIALGFVIFGWVFFGFLVTYFVFGPHAMIGYGLGMMLTAFFLRIGGGLFKASTDIGSDVLATVETKIPNFDTRNPATILDLIGDFVGDVIGFSSDLLGSFAIVIISAILFSHGLLLHYSVSPLLMDVLVQVPFYLLSISLVASVVAVGFSLLRIRLNKLQNVLMEGVYVAVVICGVGTFYVFRWVGSLVELPFCSSPLLLFYAYLLGLVGAIVIGFSSEFLTSHFYRPNRRIAAQAEYGSVVTLFNGFSLGLRSHGLFALYVFLVAAGAFYLAGVYGLVIAAMGMLSVSPLILSINIFTPLANHAKKMQLLTMEHHITGKNTKKIDALAQTTSSIGNGFATGASLLCAAGLLLLLPYVNVNVPTQGMTMDLVFLTGILCGIVLPFVFSGYLLKGLSRGILGLISEVLRQFREISYLYEHKGRPDIAKASDEQARMAMDALVVPGMLMVIPPIVLGYLLDYRILVGMGLGAFLAVFSQSFFWTHTGDALHNAKNYISSGHFGGKESPTHDYIRVADNVGDGFKDLLSPALNIWLKSVAMIIILLVAILAS